MQAFTDLVGTSASVPTHAFLSELTELTPTLDIAMAAHDTADQASEVVGGTALTTGADIREACSEIRRS
jgi:hypothetical protein